MADGHTGDRPGGSVTVSVLGTLIGLLMGGGKNGKNLILEGVLNAVTAIPPIAYLIIFIAAWGNSVFTMVVAVSASLLLRVIKLVQTRTEIEQGKAYVMCAVASGARRAASCLSISSPIWSGMSSTLSASPARI